MSADLFGRYEIRQELGRGGMARVYLAYDPTFHRQVAVKVLPPHFLENPLLRARFEREARLIATIEHPAIVPVYDFGAQGDQLYLVMRYMPGGSLSALIRQGPLPLPKTVDLLAHLAPALDAVHARGVVHRDLKPANILLDGFGNPALSDFGIAHLSEATQDLTGEAIIGTPAYMSPEQVRGEADLDGRSDIYSLGIILYEMLTGRQPYQATTPMSVAMRHLTDPVPDILQAQPGLPPELQAVLVKALAKDRTARYTHAADLVADLRAVAEARPADTRQPEALARTESEPGLAPQQNTPAGAPTEVEMTAGNSSTGTPSTQTVPAGDTPGGSFLASGLGRVVLIVGGLVAVLLLGYFGLRALRPSTQDPAATQAAIQPQATLTTAPEPLFTDDFAAPAHGWPQSSDAGGGYQYQDGAYLISVLDQDAIYWAAPDSSFADTRLRVTAKRVGGEQGFYGVFCRQQDGDNYYYFIVRPDGYFTIGKYQAAAFIPLSPGGWTPNTALHTGAEANLLEAECAGDRLRFSANGTLLGEAVDGDFAAGKPGLLAAALDDLGFQVAFDDFAVFPAEP